jgi:hypothetical protein
LIKEKTVPRVIPQVMVRIDDLQSRLDDLLLPQRQPSRGGVMQIVG